MKSIITLLFAFLVICTSNAEFLSSNSLLTPPGSPKVVVPKPAKALVPESLLSVLQKLINQKGLKEKSTCLSDGRLIVKDHKTAIKAQARVKKLGKAIKVVECSSYLASKNKIKKAKTPLKNDKKCWTQVTKSINRKTCTLKK